MQIPPLKETRIRRELSPEGLSLLAHLELLAEVDSTNTRLLDAAKEGAASGSVCLAERQSAGRGRRGRSFVSPGGNLYLSVLWRFERGAALAGLSIAVGVMAAQALVELGLETVRLKWPNDLLCRGAKLGGILVETLSQGGGVAAVSGIGVNFKMPDRCGPAIDQAWTDVTRESDIPVEARDRAAALLIDAVLRGSARFATAGIAPFKAAWDRYDAVKGHQVIVKDAERVVAEGEARGIDDDGALLLLADGRIERVLSGDLSLRMLD